ncbi:ammonium transporter [Sphingorhabdus sp. IMCC26285]|jgi:Amt family ammonium transporter|uniref:Ammonium transporter n=1 Tax=Sphingorhabdus profundilacus TaxID=2509718 RepID=A0A6I4LSN3_9SPHN|nr:ammonium transporter [Sphingorhabdus profundilacus]MVZ96437.1 ammonium transporter [Sphingorhabdus profundilacus]
MVTKILYSLLVFGALAATPAFAQDAAIIVPEANSGDSAWILTASALVLMMTIPGLALFYGGLVRAKNFLSVLVQCGAIAAVASVIWIAIGYSLAFSVNGNSYIGSPENFMFGGLLDSVREDQSIGELAFALFQMTFAIITPALIVGAWVERARFGWVVAFSALWSLLVYIPVTRWVWGGGFLAEQGVIDFAGGIVVHTTAGISALVVALMLGKRIGFPKTLMLPHSPALTVAGAGLLWVGWFGFNGGSALAANDAAASAIINTHVAASVAALIWMLIERFKVGKSTAVGFATGAVAGLATITPAAGTVGPGGAIIIGLLAGMVCFWCVGLIKGTLKIDDSLDVFAVHGVGGMLGSLLLAIFASESFGGVGYAEGAGMASQLWIQLKGVAIVAVYSAVVTLIIGYMVSMVLPMRVGEDQERDGLDIASHGERAWDLD